MSVKDDRRPPNRNRYISVLLRKVVDLVEQSPTQDVDALLRGRRALEIVPLKTGTYKKGKRSRSSYGDISFSDVAMQLHALDTREAGMRFLSNEFRTKISIMTFARFLDLPVQRTDSVQDLFEKVVESEIGSRLRSQAVQGKSPR